MLFACGPVFGVKAPKNEEMNKLERSLYREPEMTTVYCLCMIKNEADIIESYLRYHLHIFDGIVMLDNGSTDRTLEIVKRMQKEGCKIVIKHDDALAFTQGDKTTELIGYTFKHFAPDFIFPLDVDEFLTAPASPDNPRQIIDRLQTGKIYYLERDYTYFPIHIDEKELFIPKRITYASPIKDYWPKVVVSGEIWETYSPVISGGNHDLLFDKQEVELEILAPLKIRHFPYRSLEQVKSKIAVGWINTLASYSYNVGHNYHWQALFEKLKHNNFNLSIEDILKHNEVHVPMDFSFCRSLDLKYTGPNEVNAVRNLLNYTEALATRYREQVKLRRRGI